MKEDYLVFGLGHEGSLKEGEPDLLKIDVVTAATMLSTDSNEPIEYRKAELKSFNVVRYQSKDGKWYNVAFDVMPSSERVDHAVMRESPRPSSTV